MGDLFDIDDTGDGAEGLGLGDDPASDGLLDDGLLDDALAVADPLAPDDPLAVEPPPPDPSPDDPGLPDQGVEHAPSHTDDAGETTGDLQDYEATGPFPADGGGLQV